MLRLWLLCCGVMFMMAQGYEWASHQIWFGQPQLSLPWLILGGIGLAIASNHSELKALISQVSIPQGPHSATAPSTLPRVAATPASEPEKVSASSPQSPPQSLQPQSPPGKSISFEIKA